METESTLVSLATTKSIHSSCALAEFEAVKIKKARKSCLYRALKWLKVTEIMLFQVKTVYIWNLQAKEFT
jgi:hypothetical protein